MIFKILKGGALKRINSAYEYCKNWRVIMPYPKKGDRVKINCEIKLEDGVLCFKNEEDSPIEFVIGQGNFLPKIESMIQEMEEGETKILTLESEEAFGPKIDDLLLEVPKEDVQNELEFEIGSKVNLKTKSGKSYFGSVTENSETKLKLNLNHPLAGKKIIAKITLESIAEEPLKPEKKSFFKINNLKKKQNKKKRIHIPNPLKTK